MINATRGSAFSVELDCANAPGAHSGNETDEASAPACSNQRRRASKGECVDSANCMRGFLR